MASAGMPVFPEAEASSDVVFPEAGLRFVQAHGGGGAQGRSMMRRPQPLFVESMAGFVENAVKGFREVALVIAGGETSVARPQPGAKRMRRRIDAPGVKIEPEGLGHLAVESLLRGDWVIAVKKIL